MAKPQATADAEPLDGEAFTLNYNETEVAFVYDADSALSYTAQLFAALEQIDVGPGLLVVLIDEHSGNTDEVVVPVGAHTHGVGEQVVMDGRVDHSGLERSRGVARRDYELHVQQQPIPG